MFQAIHRFFCFLGLAWMLISANIKKRSATQPLRTSFFVSFVSGPKGPYGQKQENLEHGFRASQSKSTATPREFQEGFLSKLLQKRLHVKKMAEWA